VRGLDMLPCFVQWNGCEHAHVQGSRLLKQLGASAALAVMVLRLSHNGACRMHEAHIAAFGSTLSRVGNRQQSAVSTRSRFHGVVCCSLQSLCCLPGMIPQTAIRHPCFLLYCLAAFLLL
jgi:hypothetical protein